MTKGVCCLLPVVWGFCGCHDLPHTPPVIINSENFRSELLASKGELQKVQVVDMRLVDGSGREWTESKVLDERLVENCRKSVEAELFGAALSEMRDSPDVSK